MSLQVSEQHCTSPHTRRKSFNEQVGLDGLCSMARTVSSAEIKGKGVYLNLNQRSFVVSFFFFSKAKHAKIVIQIRLKDKLGISTSSFTTYHLCYKGFPTASSKHYSIAFFIPRLFHIQIIQIKITQFHLKNIIFPQ